MASSKIKKAVDIVAWNSYTKIDWSIFTVGNMAILNANIHSGNDGIAQYNQVLYQSIPSTVRPSDSKPCKFVSDNGELYSFQVGPSGSLQALSAIPANLELTGFCTWKF